MNFELFNESDVLYASDKQLKNDIRGLTCLQTIVSKKFFMALVFFEK